MHRTVCCAWIQNYAPATVPGLSQLWVDVSRMEEEWLRIHPRSGVRAPLRAPGDSNLMQASIVQSRVVGESLKSSLSDLGSGDAEAQLLMVQAHPAS